MLKIHSKIARISAACASVALLAACAGTPDPIIGAAAITPDSSLGQSDYNFARPTVYRLRTSDILSVNVFREPDLSTNAVRIGLDGNISLPMLGTIPAGGMTTVELEKDVAERLASNGLRSPMVSVNIAEYASHQVTVEGAVKTPGVFDFQPGARLSTAIALAEGPDRVAKLEQVAVFREVDGGMSIAKFDYSAVRRGTMLDPILEPGDRVVVGTSGLSQFWQDALRALPVFGVFSSISF